MVLGCYYLTTDNVIGLLGSNHYFSDIPDVLMAYDSNQIDLHSLIWVRYDEKIDFSKKEKMVLDLNDDTFIERYNNFQCRKTKTGDLLVQYIQTTAGKVIFNSIIKKTLNSN
jgi:DNA-directed RNA polymerase subunit beta'